MTDVVEQTQATSRRVAVVVAAVVGAVALVVRWIGLDLPPLAYSAHRQLTDALMSRGYWQHLGGDLPAGLPAGFEPWVPRALEPPVLQGAGALTYVVVGHEALWLPRGLLALAWVATGLAVWGLVRRTVGSTGAVVAVGVWLFAPYAVVFSRSYQPDVPMLCLVVAFLWALVRDQELAGRRSWWLAGALGAAAVFVKPTAALAVFPAMAALAWLDLGWRGVACRRFVRRVVVIAAPTVVYWVVLGATGLLGGQEQGRVDSSALTSSGFWSGWFEMATRVVPWPVVVVALAGLLVAPRRARVLGAALFAGYLVHGLVFSHHTPSHDYYHVLLLPPVLLGLASATEAVKATLARRGINTAVAVAAFGVVVAVLLLAGPRPYPYVERDLPEALAVQPGEAEAAGAFLDHTEPVLLVSRGYGILQQYYGYIKGPFWPLEADLEMERSTGSPLTATERLDLLGQPDSLELWGVAHGPIDWVLVTEPLLLEQQPELARLLATDFEVAGSGPGWTAYHRRP